MKTIALVLLLIGHCFVGWGQIVLEPAIPEERPGQNIYATINVADLREDTTAVGWEIKGKQRQTRPIVYTGGLQQYFADIIRLSLAEGPNRSKNLLIVISDFSINDGNGFILNTPLTKQNVPSFHALIYLFEGQGTQYTRFIGSYNFIVDYSVSKMNQAYTSRIATLIRQFAQQQMGYNLTTPMTVQSILEKLKSARNQEPIFKESPQKGVYLSSAAFYQNQPDDTAIEVKHEFYGSEKLTYFIKPKEKGKKTEYIPGKDAFAVCDGHQLYISNGYNFQNAVFRKGHLYKADYCAIGTGKGELNTALNFKESIDATAVLRNGGLTLKFLRDYRSDADYPFYVSLIRYSSGSVMNLGLPRLDMYHIVDRF